MTDQSCGEDLLEYAAVLPTGRLVQQFQFNVERRFDVHLRGCVCNCNHRLLGRSGPLREIPGKYFHRRLRVGRRTDFASAARNSAGCAIGPNGKQTIGVGPERYLACCDAKIRRRSITVTEQTDKASAV